MASSFTVLIALLDILMKVIEPVFTEKQRLEGGGKTILIAFLELQIRF